LASDIVGFGAAGSGFLSGLQRAAMARRIFINYRRDDEPGMAIALYGHLERKFSAKSLFMDIEGGIQPGHDFAHVLERQVSECDVMLAMVGRNWLTAADSQNRRRLDNPGDFVRIEIESALKLGKLVIPVLINRTEMPRASELPESLAPFTRRHAVRLTQERFRVDAQGIESAIDAALSNPQVAPAPPPSSESAQAWAGIKDTTSIPVLEAFVKRFGDSFYGDLARMRIEELKKVTATTTPASPPRQPAQPAVATLSVDDVLKAKIQWVSKFDVDLKATKPPKIFEHYFISLMADSSYIAPGAIVIGCDWKSSSGPGYPFWRVVHGVRASVEKICIHVGFLTYLGPVWKPEFAQLSDAVFARLNGKNLGKKIDHP
jgi:hypothetical protein